jgi:hypothetical protein
MCFGAIAKSEWFNAGSQSIAATHFPLVAS